MSETLNETSALALQMKIIDDPTWQQQRQANWDEEHQDAYAECWPRTTVKAVKQLFMRGEINRKGLAKFSAGQRIRLYFDHFPIQSREAFEFILGQLEDDEVKKFDQSVKAATFFYALLKTEPDIRYGRFADQSKAQRLAIFDWFWGDKFDLNRRVPCLVGGSSLPMQITAVAVLRHFLSSVSSWMLCAEKHQATPLWLERSDFALSALYLIHDTSFSTAQYEGYDGDEELFQEGLWRLLAGPIKSAANKLPTHIKEMNQIRDKLLARFREIADHKPAFDTLWQHIDKHGVDFEREIKITFTLSDDQLTGWRSLILNDKRPTLVGENDEHECWCSAKALDTKLRRVLKQCNPLLEAAWDNAFANHQARVQFDRRNNSNGSIMLLYIFPKQVEDLDALEVSLIDIVSQLPVSDLSSWQYFR
ncbi:hypothetical protein [Corallincola spongiicola]|uniref:Uncharacterized protein n=1 Tax=Corallincola spongiicola TaxID=2520508 RepID=A0ABY1WT57_9GAMM|nr:hypothetical protein [Corallincola spongiicola]TAA47882.1 hypothetical protein EXY25_01135 [Corallincola spongiicola]